MNAATTSAAAAPMKNASAPKALRMRLSSVLSIANRRRIRREIGVGSSPKGTIGQDGYLPADRRE